MHALALWVIEVYFKEQIRNRNWFTKVHKIKIKEILKLISFKYVGSSLRRLWLDEFFFFKIIAHKFEFHWTYIFTYLNNHLCVIIFPFNVFKKLQAVTSLILTYFNIWFNMVWYTKGPDTGSVLKKLINKQTDFVTNKYF